MRNGYFDYLTLEKSKIKTPNFIRYFHNFLFTLYKQHLLLKNNLYIAEKERERESESEREREREWERHEKLRPFPGTHQGAFFVLFNVLQWVSER